MESDNKNLKQRSAKALFWDLSSKFSRNGIGFVISIFLARILEPAEFGYVGMALVFISISQVFVDFGFASALIQSKKNTSVTYSSVFYLNIFLGLILFGIFQLIAPSIGSFYNAPIVESLVRWLSLIFVVSSLSIVQVTILTREIDFKKITIRDIISQAIGGVVGVIAAIQGLGVFALVIQQLTAATLRTIILWKLAEWSPRLEFSWSEIKRLSGFSIFLFIDRSMAQVFKRIDVLFIGKFFTPSVLGFYSRAESLNAMISKYSSTSISKVFFPVLSKIQDDDERFKSIYFKLISVICVVSFGMTVTFYLMGEEIIIGLFGSKWQPSVKIFQVLVLMIFNYSVISMMNNAILAKSKSKENFYGGMIRRTIRLIPLVIGYLYGLSAFIWALVFVAYVVTAFNIGLIKRYLHFSVKRHVKTIFECGIPAFALILGFELLSIDSVIYKLLYTVISLSLYCLYCQVLKVSGWTFLVENSKLLLNKIQRK